MDCTENCGGKVNLQERIMVIVGCGGMKNAAYPCAQCGRLHFIQGDEAHKTAVGIQRRGGGDAFWIDGEIIFKQGGFRQVPF